MKDKAIDKALGKRKSAIEIIIRPVMDHGEQGQTEGLEADRTADLPEVPKDKGKMDGIKQRTRK